MKKSNYSNVLSFDDLTTLIKNLLSAAWGNDWGTLVEAFPTGLDGRNVNVPIVTYVVKEMKPGSFGKTTEIKPRLRDSYRVDNGGQMEHIDVYSQIMDYEVEFQIWEESNVKAGELAKDFLDFMRSYTGFLKSKGAMEILFVKMVTIDSSSMRDELASKKMTFQIRLEDMYEVRSSIIEKVLATVRTSQDEDKAGVISVVIDNKGGQTNGRTNE